MSAVHHLSSIPNSDIFGLESPSIRPSISAINMASSILLFGISQDAPRGFEQHMLFCDVPCRRHCRQNGVCASLANGLSDILAVARDVNFQVCFVLSFFAVELLYLCQLGSWLWLIMSRRVIGFVKNARDTDLSYNWIGYVFVF